MGQASNPTQQMLPLSSSYYYLFLWPVRVLTPKVTKLVGAGLKLLGTLGPFPGCLLLLDISLVVEKVTFDSLSFG